MKKATEPIDLCVAGIGIAALLYGGWTIYQRHVAERDSARVLFPRLRARNS